MNVHSLVPETSASANSATSAYLVVLCCLTAERVTLAVPKIRCSLSCSPNFDRCAISLSLHRPQDAVKLNAANSATSAYNSYFYTAEPAEAELITFSFNPQMTVSDSSIILSQNIGLVNSILLKTENNFFIAL